MQQEKPAPKPESHAEAAKESARGNADRPETSEEAAAPEHHGLEVTEDGTPHAEELDPLALLRAEVESLSAETKMLRDQALRAMAEAENTRRRAEREKSDAVKYAALPLLRDLVKVADNMSRAMAAAGAETEEESAATKALREGIALTEKELLSAFTRHGVERIDPMGEPMDPERHEAMFEVPDETAEPGTVVQVLEPGWMLHGRLVRAARVGVARKP